MGRQKVSVLGKAKKSQTTHSFDLDLFQHLLLDPMLSLIVIYRYVVELSGVLSLIC